MKNEDYLITLLFDLYETVCALIGIVDDDFDKLFVDENGYPLTDKEYLIKNKIYDNDLIRSMYQSIFSSYEECAVDTNSLINEFIATYYVYHYDTPSKKNIINYIASASFEDLNELYQTNEGFGCELIETYFDSIRNQEKYITNRGTILSNIDSFKTIMRFEFPFTTFSSLNSFCKNSIIKLYNHYTNNGCSDIESLNNVWAYFTHNFIPKDLFTKSEADLLLSQDIKRISLLLIYSDLYEDVMNTPIIDTDNDKQRIANFLPIFMISLSICTIPSDVEIRNRMLKQFVLLQDDKEKLRLNRAKTYNDNRVMMLKRYNDDYVSDEYFY